MKATIIYHSVTGNTEKMAEVIVEGMNTVDGMEARAFSVDEVDVDWGNNSKCIILGTPTYAASLSGAMKVWLDKAPIHKGMVGSLGGAFATARYVDGGGDLAVRTILDHMLVMSMLTYSGGMLQGKPAMHVGPVAIEGKLEDSMEAFRGYGQHMASKAMELWGK